MSDHPKHDEIQREIDDNDVVLFMKCSPKMPQCGFSAAVSQVLTVLGVK
ncbi:MAG: monothiol glutaredoxin, Grx4 family, partial [Rhodospirillales bacterium]